MASRAQNAANRGRKWPKNHKIEAQGWTSMKLVEESGVTDLRVDPNAPRTELAGCRSSTRRPEL